jgi:acyl-CoA oxidase
MPLIAKTMVINCGINSAKKFFANPKGREFEIIKTLCAVKAIASWHSADVGTVCRERCGGAAYLSYNAIWSCISGGHSGMTAEGDNSVLMQKVVKDILQHYRDKTHKMP